MRAKSYVYWCLAYINTHPAVDYKKRNKREDGIRKGKGEGRKKERANELTLL
jgi:hypothetical protein